MTPFTQILVAILTGIAGFFIAWIIRFRAHQKELHALKDRYNDQYVPILAHSTLQQEAARHRDTLSELRAKIASKDTTIAYHEKQIATLTTEKGNVLNSHRADLTLLSSDLAKQFSEKNQHEMLRMITPLKESLDAYREKVVHVHERAAKDTAGLREVVIHLSQQSKEVTTQAESLARALRGDSQIQGSWGEVQLERLLEMTGLQKEVHYTMQKVFIQNGTARQRPDCIVHLPGDRNVVVDVKVSLTAFEKYVQAKIDGKGAAHLKDHLQSVKAHIKNLSSKNYQSIAELNTPDFIILFMPVEQAFLTAVQHDRQLLEFALRKNILIVSPSTFLLALRLIEMQWRHVAQQQNADEIAREAGALLDKFSGVQDDMSRIGKALDQIRTAFNGAVNKLFRSPRKGDTMYGRLERIKKLGAETTKELREVELLD